MAVDFSKFEGGDFKRVPGATRSYVNTKTGDVISRRQFDQHYGAARAFGTLEKKAKIKSSEDNAILRPARGRTDARKLSASEKIVEANRRKLEAQEAAAQKRIDKELTKKHVIPKKITIKNLRPGHISRAFTVSISEGHDGLESLRREGKSSGKVFSYIVGGNLINDLTGGLRTYTQFAGRYIGDPYTLDDFKELVEHCRKLQYATLVSFYIRLMFEKVKAKAHAEKSKNKPARKKAATRAKPAAKRKPARKQTRKKAR
jgi:hypothetical protein